MTQFYLRTTGEFGIRDFPIEVFSPQFSDLFFAVCPEVSKRTAGYGTTLLEALVNLTNTTDSLYKFEGGVLLGVTRIGLVHSKETA